MSDESTYSELLWISLDIAVCNFRRISGDVIWKRRVVTLADEDVRFFLLFLISEMTRDW